MKMFSLRDRLQIRRLRSSSALLITLVMLSVIVILAVSLLLLSSQDLRSTNGYTRSQQAGEIARGGLATVIAQFQQEIEDPSFSFVKTSSMTGASNIYVPLPNGANFAPQRMAGSSATNVVAYSCHTNAFYSGINQTLAAAISTTNTSLNGVVIPPKLWMEPKLAAASETLPVPDWIPVTRTGPTNLAGLNPTALTAKLGNKNAVVGRYAYIIYDVSGLLDINAVGYPTMASSLAVNKGIPPYADMTNFLVATQAASSAANAQTDLNNLISFRNAYSSSGISTYTNSIAQMQSNGFLQVVPPGATSDNAFLSRQDLIQFTQQSGNSDWQKALPFLTTFSRELNGPTWGPDPTPATANVPDVNYQSLAQSDTTGGSSTFNPYLFTARVQAPGGWTRLSGVTAVAGEPLAKYRFPLDKLALLQGDVTHLTAAQQQEIYNYFGLTLVTSGSYGNTGFASTKYYRHWSYGHGAATGILTLDQVAALNREPDFFELLQAVVLSNSVGSRAPDNHYNNTPSARYDYDRGYGYDTPGLPPVNGEYTAQDPDTSSTDHILKIGACIIDQYGSDNYPTTITSLSGYDVYGIKDLPYIKQIFAKAYVSASKGTINDSNPISASDPVGLYLYFELWNPHQLLPGANTTTLNLRVTPYVGSFPSASLYDQYNVAFAVGAGTPGMGTTTGTVTGPIYLYWDAVNNDFSTSKTENSINFIGEPASTINNEGAIESTGNSNPQALQYIYNPTVASASNAGFDYREANLLLTSPSSPHPATGPWTPTPSTPSVGIVNLGQLTASPFPALLPLSNGTSNFTGTVTYADFYQPNLNNFFDLSLDVTYLMQYEDPGQTSGSGVWHTYGCFAGAVSSTGAGQPLPNITGAISGYSTGSGTPAGNTSFKDYSLLKIDPRTARFGPGEGNANNYNEPMVASATGVPFSVPVVAAPFCGRFPAPEYAGYRFDYWALNDGMQAPTGSFNPEQSVNYLDRDQVYRYGDSYYDGSGGGYSGFPSSSPVYPNPASNKPSPRPVILNRPFQSVGELGYAFRDLPWKTLDFFSPTSADAGLLDVFTLSDSPVVAGRVNPNTPHPEVLEALLNGVLLNPGSTSTVTLTPAAATTLATSIVSTTSVVPIKNRGDIVSGYMANTANLPSVLPITSGIKTEQESIVRALAESANTRTLNLLIDLVAQSGRYPTNVTATALVPDKFVVEGQRHVWLHVAIDRYTGQVIDQQLEPLDQ